VALAGTSRRGRGAVLAMADRHVLTRIRRLLNLEERSMRLTMPEGLGLLGAAVVGISLALGLPAAQLPPVSDSNEKLQQVPGKAVGNIKDKPALEARPPSERVIREDSYWANWRPRRAAPRNPRSITIFRRDERQLQIVQLPTTSDGVTTYRCRGGIEIVCKSQKGGTVRMEADEAVIKRVDGRSDDEPFLGTHGETWFDEADLPMEVHLNGNAIIRRDEEKFTGKGDQRTVRAPRLDYDFVAGRVVARPAETEMTDPGLETPSKDDIEIMPGHAPQDVPVRDAPPARVISGDTSSTARLPATRDLKPLPPSGQRATSLFPRTAQRLQITQLPRTIEGVVTCVCRGGIKIVSKSPKFGTVSIEADEAVIVRNLYRRKGDTLAGPNGETWVEEDELPMAVHLKGDVIFRQDQYKFAGMGDTRTVRARELNYDFVADRLLALNAELEVAAPGLAKPFKTVSSRIEQFHPVVRRPDGSIAPSEHREIRAGEDAKLVGPPNPVATTRDSKPSEP
jgi:hypothetical protein